MLPLLLLLSSVQQGICQQALQALQGCVWAQGSTAMMLQQDRS
jgi:methionine salvage enolase-phosphatase E1